MKRRKLKENPYTINYFQNMNIYSVCFKESNKNKEIIISKQLYEQFNKFELEDKSFMNKYERHIERSELTENSLHTRMFNEILYTEDIVLKKIQNENLYVAINKLPKTQKNRLIDYYFNDISKKDIALKEKCSIRAIKYSIDIALEKLRDFFNKF